MQLRSSVFLKRIYQRLSMNMASYSPNNGTRRSGSHDTLISINSAVQKIMDYLAGKDNKKFHGNIRAVDVRNVLLLMPFVMQDVLLPEVNRWNSTHSQDDKVEDPSNSLVDILCLLLEWYQRFRKPEHSVKNIVDLDERGRDLIQKCTDVFPKVKTVTVNGQGENGLLTTL
jgi:hypothetical protein